MRQVRYLFAITALEYRMRWHLWRHDRLLLAEERRRGLLGKAAKDFRRLRVEHRLHSVNDVP